MWIEYEKAVEVLAERYGLVMLCEEKGLPFAGRPATRAVSASGSCPGRLAWTTARC